LTHTRSLLTHWWPSGGPSGGGVQYHTSTRVSILGDELRVQGVGFSSVFRLQKAEYNITTPSLVAFLQNDHWWSFFKLI
jgi:hypothetical protein